MTSELQSVGKDARTSEQCRVEKAPCRLDQGRLSRADGYELLPLVGAVECIEFDDKLAFFDKDALIA